MRASISRASAALAAILLVYIVAHTMLEIVLRSVFGASTLMLNEMGGYALAAITFLSLPYTFSKGGLLRVQSLRQAIPEWACRILEVSVVALTFVIIVYINWFVWRDIARNFSTGAQTDSYVPIPLWMPPCVALVGLSLFALDLAIYLADLLRGRPLMVDSASETA